MTEVKESLKAQTVVSSPLTSVTTAPTVQTETQTKNQAAGLKMLRVGILMGGASSEKEISLESARHVYNNLDREKYFVLPIFVDEDRRFWLIEEWQLWKNTTADLVESLHQAGVRIYWEELKEKIDFVFSCLHGKYGEEALPGLLEILKIPNNCASVLGGALSMDKFLQRKILEAEGIPVPSYLAVKSSEFRTPNEIENCKLKIENYLGYPFMVKPCREGSSTALHKVKSRGEVDVAFNDAFQYDNVVLAEEVLEGMELTTTVYGFGGEVKALPPSQLLKGGDYLTAEEKFLPGGAQMITPPPLAPELIEKVQETSIKAFRSLGLKIYSRIDSFLIGPGFSSLGGNVGNHSSSFAEASADRRESANTLDDYRVVILEPNNPPAMTPSTALWLQAAEAGFSTSQFLDEIIRISREAHASKLGPL